MLTKTKLIQIFLALMVSASLFSCGGGSDDEEVADGNGGGINGTGITSLGVITQFGSIYINGIRFDIDNATFMRDGKRSTGQHDFSIGEYISIKGTVNTDKTTGTAAEVTFTDILEGEVTKITNNNLRLEVLGQTLKVTKQTKLHEFNNLNELVVGNIVEISGFKGANSTTTVTSIKLKKHQFEKGDENEVKGLISSLNSNNKTFHINNIIVDYSGAKLKDFKTTGLQNGQFVEVKSSSKLSNNTLIASEIELEKEGSSDIKEGSKVELEGLVTRFVSITDFDVNNIKVTTNSQTKFKDGKAQNLSLNTLLEVKGSVNSAGVLVAREISFEKEDD